MIRRKEDIQITYAAVRGGNGEPECRHLVEGKDELYQKGRAFNHMVLTPGQSIGRHQHAGDTEWFYVTKGTGLYDDNGTEVTVGVGDVLICHDGEWHGFVNNSDEDLEFIALIIYTD